MLSTGRHGSSVVRMLAFSSNVPSSNLSEVYSVFCKQNCLKRTEINPKIANNVSLGLLTDWLSSLRHCFKGNFHHIHQALIPRNRKSFCDRKDELLEKQIIKDNGTKNGGKQAYQIWTVLKCQHQGWWTWLLWLLHSLQHSFQQLTVNVFI